jgi:CobQ-like glutamine amidotransferase family enzyme
MSSLDDSTVTVVLLFPDLLGTYGDSGNAVILAQRLRWRGIRSRVVTVRSGDAVPHSCEIYVVGGGEDLPQALAARQLGSAAASPLSRAVGDGATVLAVCAGLQIIGTRFVFGPDGALAEGLGLVDCETGRGRGPRSVGEIAVEPDPRLGIPVLTGYENHAGATTVGRAAKPAGRVVYGTGNGDGSGTDGVWSGKVFGTYLHGPVLARNPALADLLLSWVVGDLAPIDDTEASELRNERLASGRLERAGARNPLARLRGQRS